MKTKNLILTIAGMAVFALGGFWLGQQSGSSATDVEQTAAAGEQEAKSDPKGDDREILYWQAPMNPSEIYDKPGKSKMGMDLVPVYADGAQSSEGQVKINPVVQQNMNVRTAEVERKDLSTTVNAVGKVDYDEQKLYNVNTKVSGWIEKLYVDYTGKLVRKGQPLFSIYSPELVTTQQEYLLALKARDRVSSSNFATIRKGGNSLLEATRKRLEYWDIPPEVIEGLEKNGEIQKTVDLKAPATGVVLHKNAVEGEYIKAGADAFRIADLSTVWVQVSVYDYELPWISEGQKAEMELSYQPGKTYEGTVNYIYPDLDSKTRTARVRLEFKNPNLELKPGMYADVRILSRPKNDVTVIPNEAVIRTGDRDVVFVARGEGTFEPREVTLGVEGGKRNNEVEVLSGVKAGEQIVISAQFLLDSESRLQEAIQKMLQQKSEPKEAMEGMDMNGASDATPKHQPTDTAAHSDMNM